MDRIDIYLFEYNNGKRRVDKILHDGQVVTEYDEESHKSNFTGLYFMQDEVNYGRLIINYEDESKKTEIKDIAFNVVKTKDGFAIDLM